MPSTLQSKDPCQLNGLSYEIYLSAFDKLVRQKVSHLYLQNTPRGNIPLTLVSLSSKCNTGQMHRSWQNTYSPNSRAEPSQASSLSKILILITKSQKRERSNGDGDDLFFCHMGKLTFSRNWKGRTQVRSLLASSFISTISQLSFIILTFSCMHLAWGGLHICDHAYVWVQVHEIGVKNHPQLILVVYPIH